MQLNSRRTFAAVLLCLLKLLLSFLCVTFPFSSIWLNWRSTWALNCVRASNDNISVDSFLYINYFIIRIDDSAILKHIENKMIYVPIVLSLVRYQITPTTAIIMKMIFRILRIWSLLMIITYRLATSWTCWIWSLYGQLSFCGTLPI